MIKSDFDLTALMRQVEELQRNAEILNKSVEKNLSDYEHTAKDIRTEFNFKEINSGLMELSRILNPALSSKVGKYGQDPLGSKFKSVPTLQPLEKLKLMDSSSDEYKALRTSLLRGRNKLSDALNSANRILAGTLNKIQAMK